MVTAAAFDATPFIIALAIVLAGAFLAYRHVMHQRHINERIAKVARPGQLLAARGAASLRKSQEQTGFLNRFIPSQRTLRARLLRAGIDLSLNKLAKLVLLALTVSFVVLLLVLNQPLHRAALGAVMLALGIPHLLIGMKGTRRVRAFIELFPEAIDLIVRGLRSGLPVGESFKVVASEVGDPVSPVFAQITERIKLGVPMDQALQDAANQLQSTEFNFFITTINLQRETGGNLGEILSNLSQVLRDRTMMRLKIKALSAEAKASAIIVGILPIMVGTILHVVAPEYLAPLFNDPRGLKSFYIGVGMMGTGIFVMAKMTRFEI